MSNVRWMSRPPDDPRAFDLMNFEGWVTVKPEHCSTKATEMRHTKDGWVVGPEKEIILYGILPLGCSGIEGATG